MKNENWTINYHFNIYYIKNISWRTHEFAVDYNTELVKNFMLKKPNVIL